MNNKEVKEKYTEIKLEMYEGVVEAEFGWKVEAIGWLDILEPFEKGKVPDGFVEKLRNLYNNGIIIMTMGFHECEFCIDEKRSDIAKSSIEKLLRDEENKIEYIFPEMIFHYMEEHNFKPSNAFINFVIR